MIIPTASNPISTPTIIPVVGSVETQGKEVLVEPVQTKAHKEVIPEDFKK